MAAIPMIHPMTVETAQQYAVNAGLIAVDLDLSKATDAATLLAAVKAAPDKWLGATSGTTTITEGRKAWNPSHNARRLPVKGDQHFDSAQPSIKAKLVQMNSHNIPLQSGTSEVTTNGAVTTIKPKAVYALESYKTVHWLTNLGAEGVILITLKNAICVDGINWSIEDKGIATADVNFLAHADDMSDIDYLPIECKLYKAAAS